jgi:hypothetical protein
MNFGLIGLIAFTLLTILFIVLFIAFVYVSANQYKRRYLKDIKRTFQTRGHTIINVENAGEVDEGTQEVILGGFLMNYEVSAIHTFYKRVIYLDELQNRRICIVSIKKFLFVILSINYKFED